MTRTIRKYRPTDRVQTSSIWFRAGKDEYTYLDNWRELSGAQAACVFEEVIERNCDIWVAEDTEVVAFLAMKDSYIDRLYVDPSRQGCGWGSRLLAKTKALFPHGLESHTHQQNTRARSFYEKHGFQAVKFGTSPPPESAPDVEYHWRP